MKPFASLTPSRLATAFVVCGAVIALSTWISSTGFGQQGGTSRVRTPPRPTNASLQISGNLHVRMSYPESLNDAGREKYVENVSTLSVSDEWVTLSLVEEEEPATLIIPREKLFYLKVWDVKDEEK